MKPRNIIEKIWDSHVVAQKEGHPAVLAIDLMLIHEVTSAQAFQMLRDKNLPITDKTQFIATIDHSTPTDNDRKNIKDLVARKQVDTLRANVAKSYIKFFDFDSGHQGVIHVIGPELGAVQPGMTIVCGDSHTATHGAFGALAFGIGTTEVGCVLGSGCILQKKPKTFKVKFEGVPAKNVYSKDLIMKLIATIGIGGANGHAIEYTGDAISNMSMEARMSLCNMSIECGARAGLIAPDEKTINYIKGKSCAPSGSDFDAAAERWKLLASDAGCSYDKEITINIDNLKPMVTWGTNPEQAVGIDECIPHIKDLPETHRLVAKQALEYVKLKEGQAIAGIPIDYAFLGSCTNGRIEDLRIAAEVIKGKKVAYGVMFFVVPGSEAVKRQAEAEGLSDIFLDAGAQWSMPGCSMCLAMNDDKVPAGKRCVSSSNRNFANRQGPGSLTHLASPATVAASAIAGVITQP